MTFQFGGDPIICHCSRSQLLNATVGFTLVTRRAGTRHARSAININTSGATTNVSGSRVHSEQELGKCLCAEGGADVGRAAVVGCGADEQLPGA